MDDGGGGRGNCEVYYYVRGCDKQYISYPDEE